MVKALSDDLRLRVVGPIESGLTRHQAAAKYNVSVASAVRWHQRFRQTGSVEPDGNIGKRNASRAEGYVMIGGTISKVHRSGQGAKGGFKARP